MSFIRVIGDRKNINPMGDRDGQPNEGQPNGPGPIGVLEGSQKPDSGIGRGKNGDVNGKIHAIV